MEVPYSTALRGKHRTVHDLCGTPKEGYKNVFSYLYMLEKVNPCSKTSMLLDGEKRFKYLFDAFGACMEGFEYMRKVIILDETFLKVVKGGILTIATAQDPNHHHYPLDINVADGKKKESWN